MKDRQELFENSPVQGTLDFDEGHARPTVIEKRLYVAFSNPSLQSGERSIRREASAMDILVAHAKSLSW